MRDPRGGNAREQGNHLPESELAQRHGAGVATSTPEPDEAYAGFAEDLPIPYREGWLPG